MSNSFLTISGLYKRFGDVTALKNINLTVGKGEIFALLGSSGCGKSTLLRLLGGFDEISDGELWLDGERLNDVPAEKRPANMMFQSYALFPHLTVFQNLAYGLKRDGMKRSDITFRVEEMLKTVKMEHLAQRKPAQLSGGQQQRVALARALIKGPKLLLLDEPMGALDKKLRAHMQLEISRIIELLGVTCVMVTHDQEEAMTMADRVAVMDCGQICQIGTPREIYEQPCSRFVAEFIGSVNMLSGEVTQNTTDSVIVKSPDLETELHISHGLTCHREQQLNVALRPEKVMVSRERPLQDYNFTYGEIIEIAYMGSQSTYHVKLASGVVMMVTDINVERSMVMPFTWNEQVWLYWSPIAVVAMVA